MKNKIKTYEIKTQKLENGKGYLCGVVVDGDTQWDRPWSEIGENYENMNGLPNEADAVIAAAHCINNINHEQNKVDIRNKLT